MDGHHYWLNMIRLRSKLILKYLNKIKDTNLQIRIETVLGVDHKLNKMTLLTKNLSHFECLLPNN